MRRAVLVAMLGAACLLSLWSFGTWAQVIDSSPCEQSCYKQKSICVTACGEHTNPVECEAQCQDDLLDCLRECS